MASFTHEIDSFTHEIFWVTPTNMQTWRISPTHQYVNMTDFTHPLRLHQYVNMTDFMNVITHMVTYQWIFLVPPTHHMQNDRSQRPTRPISRVQSSDLIIFLDNRYHIRDRGPKTMEGHQQTMGFIKFPRIKKHGRPLTSLRTEKRKTPFATFPSKLVECIKWLNNFHIGDRGAQNHGE